MRANQSQIEPMQKMAAKLLEPEPLRLNGFESQGLSWGVKKLVLQWECVCATFVPLELELNQGVDCSGDLGQSLLWTT